MDQEAAKLREVARRIEGGIPMGSSDAVALLASADELERRWRRGEDALEALERCRARQAAASEAVDK